MFVTNTAKKRIHAAWTKKQEEMIAFIRISFIKPEKINKPKKKNVFLKFILKIIDGIPKKKRIVRKSRVFCNLKRITLKS